MAEAVAQSRRGLDVLADLPDDGRRQQQELDLQTALGAALAATNGPAAAEVGQTLARARLLAEQLDRPEHLVPLIAGKWGFHIVRAEYRSAVALAVQLEQIGDARNDVVTQSLGRSLHGLPRVYLGEFVGARADLERCIRLADPLHRTTGGLPFDPYVSMLPWLALALACLGCVDQARARIDEALSKARQLGHAHTLALVLRHSNWFDWITGSPMVHATEFLALTTEHGFSYYLGWAHAHRGQSFCASDKRSKASHCSRRGWPNCGRSEAS